MYSKKSSDQTHECQKPQLGNTGVTTTEKGLQIGLDWFSGTFPDRVLGHIRALVEETFTDKFSDCDHGLNWYKSCAESTHGITLGSDYRGNGGYRHGLLDIPGKVLRLLTAVQQMQFFSKLDQLGFRMSRGDIALDDYDKSYSPMDAYEAWQTGNISGFRLHTGRWQQSGHPSDPARTLYLGKRGKNGGGKQGRIYDKSKESKGEYDCIRCEVAFYGDCAHQLWSAMADVAATGDEQQWVQLLGGWLSGAVRFLDRSVSRSANRCPNLDWWQRLIDGFQRLKAHRVRPIVTLERASRWIFNQVGPTLALLMEAFTLLQSHTAARRYLAAAIASGNRRWNKAQLAILEQIKHQRRSDQENTPQLQAA